MTKVPVVGLLPYLPNMQIDAEDGVSIDGYAAQPRPDTLNVAVVRLPHISNFTDFGWLYRLSGCR